ncbi:MAG: hypothetical protein KF688_07875 [Pirellulales bacterium]|nr:hypothetical protein [Pirellulales bacterium]
MNEPELTTGERRFLDDLRKLPTSVRSRLVGWGCELVLPSIALFVYGLIADRRLFVVLGFLSLLYFTVWRMYGQLRGFRMLHSIYQKQLSRAEQINA